MEELEFLNKEDINNNFQVFKINEEAMMEYMKNTKRNVTFNILNDEKYEFFYKPVATLKKENYFIYGLLLHVFRRHLHKDKKGELCLNILTKDKFKDYLEGNYKKELKCIEVSDGSVTDELYKTYSDLLPNFICRYKMLNEYVKKKHQTH